MAVYRFCATIVGRTAGRSATAAAAYRAAERIEDERTGLAHDYRRRSGVLFREILTPDNAPAWMQDRAQLWNAVERIEKRKDAQLARELQLALPHELNDEQRTELVRSFVREQFVAKGMVADIAIHAPDRLGDNRNHHAHVMLTLRDLLGEGFGKKQRDWNAPDQLEEWRREWAEHQNRALERAGSKERVDHRSLEAQGLDREPEPKLGPHAHEMEQRGQPSERGDELRKVRERNQLRDELRKEAEVIDLAIERERRAEAERAVGKKWRREDDQPETARQQRAAEHEQAKEQRRFEAWANAKRAELQNRQLGDKGDLGRRHTTQRLLLEDRLAETYGAGIEMAERTLAEIRERQQASRFFRFVYRLSGQAGQDAYASILAGQTLNTIRQRMTEQRGKLEVAQAADRRELDHSHERQSRTLEHRIETVRERREREGWKPLPARGAANDEPKTETTWQRIQRRRAEQRSRDRDPDRER